MILILFDKACIFSQAFHLPQKPLDRSNQNQVKALFLPAYLNSNT